MKTSTVPNPNHDQKQTPTTSEQKMEFHFGLIGGIPLPKETLALIALKRLYAKREEIVRKVVFKLKPEFINEAQELTQALLMAEKLLHDAGIRTELTPPRPSDPELRYTFLQIVDDVLQSNTPMPSIQDHALFLATANKQFRPWIKQDKTLAKAA